MDNMCVFFRRGFILFVLAVGVGVFLSCVQPNVPAASSGSDSLYPDSVHKVELNSAGYGVLRLEGLEPGKKAYLSRVNATRVEYSANIVSAEKPVDPERLAEGVRMYAGTITMPDGETRVLYERHWQVTPPDYDTPLASRSVVFRSVSDTEGTQKSFYVDVSAKTLTATLRKIGEYCKIWVDSSLVGINEGQINELAAKFDAIYPIETNLLGYEYGGGPGGNGGVDGDPLVQILVYDIDGDSPGGNTMGYFYPGDEYQRGKTYPYSNEAEIFYLDPRFFNGETDKIYSTMIHEFNHMINFNVKVLQGGQIRVWNNETWYTEMLSMLAEDVIWPAVGSGGPSPVIGMRIPNWCSNYDKYSVMYWPSANAYAIPYYESNYAFGAYLVRNFGGVPLFSAIAKSHAGGRASIDGSLRAYSNDRNIDVTYALERFGETLVYFDDSVPEKVYSLNKGTQSTMGNDTYTFNKINIQNGSLPGTPAVFDFKAIGQTPMPFNTVQIFQDASWTDIQGGRLDIHFLGVDTSAKYFVLIK
jgi:hypothetical protein